MMRFVSLIAAAGFGLAACSPPAGQGPAATAPLAAGPPKITPGLWRTTITVLEIENPAIPKELLAQALAAPLVVEDCVTSDDIRGIAAQGGAVSDGCARDFMTFAGGRITGAAVCPGEDGGPATELSVDGTYSNDRMEMLSTVAVTDPASAMRTKSRVVSERLGACAAGG